MYIRTWTKRPGDHCRFSQSWEDRPVVCCSVIRSSIPSQPSQLTVEDTVGHLVCCVQRYKGRRYHVSMSPLVAATRYSAADRRAPHQRMTSWRRAVIRDIAHAHGAHLLPVCRSPVIQHGRCLLATILSLTADRSVHRIALYQWDRMPGIRTLYALYSGCGRTLDGRSTVTVCVKSRGSLGEFIFVLCFC